jgi:hypothetical protein
MNTRARNLGSGLFEIVGHAVPVTVSIPLNGQTRGYSGVVCVLVRDLASMKMCFISGC